MFARAVPLRSTMADEAVRTAEAAAESPSAPGTAGQGAPTAGVPGAAPSATVHGAPMAATSQDAVPTAGTGQDPGVSDDALLDVELPDNSAPSGGSNPIASGVGGQASAEEPVVSAVSESSTTSEQQHTEPSVQALELNEDEWIPIAGTLTPMVAHLAPGMEVKEGYRLVTSITQAGNEATHHRVWKQGANIGNSHGPLVTAIVLDADSIAYSVEYDATLQPVLRARKFGISPIPAWFVAGTGGTRESGRVVEQRRQIADKAENAFLAIWERSDAVARLEGLLGLRKLFPIRSIIEYRPKTAEHGAGVLVKWRGKMYQDPRFDSWVEIEQFQVEAGYDQPTQEIAGVQTADPRVVSAYKRYMGEEIKAVEAAETAETGASCSSSQRAALKEMKSCAAKIFAGSKMAKNVIWAFSARMGRAQ